MWVQHFTIYWLKPGTHYTAGTAGLAGEMRVKLLAQGNTTTGVASHSTTNTVGSTGAM